uniref:Uncharacterized protein n=1 Tax=Oryza sativa subsp. japonica TaxID=39947 RepID=Q6YZT2_ORYSJ|nr:hypothetical protein [Oryza sativa Japonica Group]
MAVTRGGGPRRTGSTDREGGGAPRGADLAPTRRPRGSHAGGPADGPDLPSGRSDGGGSVRPARTGGSGRPDGHGAQRRYRGAAAANGGDRRRPAGGGGGGVGAARAARRRHGG